MGIKSVMNTDRLYWLGRYSERVYTTLKLFTKSFDELIEQFGGDHASFCESLEIPNIYTDKDDFIGKYAFSLEDPNSIISNLMRAYDNAIELREEIGSETLAYIQMAVYEMQRAEISQAPAIHFMKVTDHILAFWGIVDDQIDDENTRNIIKFGKRVERLDLYARIRRPKADIEREVSRLAGRAAQPDLVLDFNHESIFQLKALIMPDELNYHMIVDAVERIMDI